MNLVLSTLERASVSGGVALLVVGTLCRILPKLPASWRCNLWRLAYLKCLAALFIVGAVAVPILPKAAPVVAPMKETTSTPPVAQVAPAKAAPILPGASPAALSDVPVSQPVSSAPQAFPWARLAVALYATGVLLGVARVLLAAFRVRGIVRRAQPAEFPALNELSSRLGLRRAPRLARSEETPSPILVPGTILLSLAPSAEDRLFVAHELAHLRRNDLLWEWLGVLTQTIFWFHPLVWLARKEERMAREQAADALAVRAAAAPPADYARALLDASLRRNGCTPLLSVGVLEKGSRLRQRLEALAQPSVPHRRLLAFGTFAALVAVVALVPWRAVARQRAASSPLKLRGVMSGLVLDEAGRPVSGAEVSWVVPYDPKPSIIAKATTNKSGEFVFDTVPGTSTYAKTLQERWRQNLDGWVMVKASGKGLGIQRVRFAKRAVTIHLTPPQTYSASFRDASGKPVVGLSVWCHSLDNNHNSFPLPWLGFSGKTDARGEFHATGLPQNDHVWFEFDKSQWRWVEQEETSRTHITHTLDTGYTIEGDVRFPDGKPLSKSFLSATGQSHADGYTNAQGHFKLQGLAPGLHALRVQINRTGDFVAPNNLTVTISPSVRVLRRDITLVPAARIVGRVTDLEGKPMREVSLGSGSATAYTDEDGRYELSVPEGEAQVSLENRDPKTVRARLGTKTTLDFSVPRASIVEIEGEVLDSNGEPVGGASVEVGQEGSSTVTDGQGKFRWKSREKEFGKIGVFVHKGSEGAFVEVTPGKIEPLTLKLSEAGIGHLSGRVTDAAGKPIQSVQIAVAQGKPIVFANQSLPTDAQGRFRIPVRSGARCYMSFSASGYGELSKPGFLDLSKPNLAFSVDRPGIDVNGTETKDLGQIVLARGDATLTGKLLDPEGKPIGPASVILIIEDSVWPGKSDTDGNVSIPHLVEGGRGTLIAIDTKRRRSMRQNVSVGNLGAIRLDVK